VDDWSQKRLWAFRWRKDDMAFFEWKNGSSLSLVGNSG
jgi:hypothetical protein